jgi:Spy/CpxP family protein refolding chaperone
MKAHTAIQMAIITVALLAAGLVGAAQAGPGPGPGPGFGEHRPPMERMLGGGFGEHGRWWNNPTVMDKLKLTDDQRKAMDDILQQHREQLIDMRASVEKAEVAMQPLIDADQPNESAILSQIDRIAQARAELEKANARFLLALRSKLTPDQWKQLQAMRAEHRGRMDNRQWRGRDRRQTPPGTDGGQGTPAGNPPPGPGEPQAMLIQPGPAPTAELSPAPDAGTIS